MLEPPEGYRDIDETVMSNFDHSIDRSLAERLHTEKVTMQYTGHLFYGRVWFERQFHCLVSTFGIPRQTFSAETLEDLMDQICAEYGHE